MISCRTNLVALGSKPPERMVELFQNRPFSGTPSQLLTQIPTRMLDLCQNLCQNQNIKTPGLS